jgi:hypothetical protein
MMLGDELIGDQILGTCRERRGLERPRLGDRHLLGRPRVGDRANLGERGEVFR